MLLWRLQKVTIEDVKDEESDLTPTPMMNGVSENKISRDNSFSSNKYSDKTSIKVIKTLRGNIKKKKCIFKDIIQTKGDHQPSYPIFDKLFFDKF